MHRAVHRRGSPAPARGPPLRARAPPGEDWEPVRGIEMRALEAELLSGLYGYLHLGVSLGDPDQKLQLVAAMAGVACKVGTDWSVLLPSGLRWTQSFLKYLRSSRPRTDGVYSSLVPVGPRPRHHRNTPALSSRHPSTMAQMGMAYKVLITSWRFAPVQDFLSFDSWLSDTVGRDRSPRLTRAGLARSHARGGPSYTKL